MTLTPDVGSDVVALAIVPGTGCSVKDSFATLDLRPHGFEVLFDARWIYRRPLDLSTPAVSGWAVVDSAPALNLWLQAAGDAVDVPREALLDPDVRVVAADGLAAGAIANRTGSVVGISNVFARDGVTAATWIGATRALDAAYAGTPIVGYCHSEDVHAARNAGFEDVGPLRVWLAR